MSKPQLSDLLLGGPGHDGYTYNADVYCVDCGQDIIRDLYAEGKYDEGDNGDSNDFPQPIFFGESDCAEHCGSCGEYLYGEDAGEDGDDLCDMCMSSGVNVERTTWCGKTIGIECGCEKTCDGTCGNPDCEDCREGADEDEE